VSDAPVRRRVVCRGAVQGVGFRPSVYRLATSLGLAGWVRNDPAGATVEVEGLPAIVGLFVDRLPSELPRLARLDGIEVSPVEPRGEDGFRVVDSASGRREGALVPADAALCPDCRAELDDPGDRRHHYPFTTCTNCGPRFSLVAALPYDRERTSMACFPLCPACRGEYEDPADRRFHAEPVCCPACGPRLWLAETAGSAADPGAGPPPQGDAAAVLARAKRLLEAGATLAVKGLGGFQLACRADDATAVERLRERKRRPSKPFAVMVRDLAAARSLVDLDAATAATLSSPRAPVVLAPRLADGAVTDAVAPGLADLGLLLPTTPLHVELFRDAAYDALVMTSGNASDEPICRGNREAVDRLAGIADAFVLHDRDVLRRVDDSVVRSAADGPFLVRRARGWVPDPLPLPEPAPEPVLALGPFLQATACVAAGDLAVPSQHVGDLDGEAARQFLAEVAAGLEEFLQVAPRVVAVDSHPDYPSTWLGERLAAARGGRVIRVQHHLAHAAATLAEHGAFPAPGWAAAALVLDGTGWGEDGTSWGGEWLALDGGLEWRRLGSLAPLPLVGGELAVREPWRVAVAGLALSGRTDLVARTPLAGSVPEARLEAVSRLAASPGWPLASGAGRLFEAAGALCGVASVNQWEGEAAARLEALAAGTAPGPAWDELALDGTRRLPAASLLVAAAERLAGGEDAARVAAGFHAAFCRLAAELSAAVVPAGTTTVALGGGCLVNRLLRRGLAEEHRKHGLEVRLPRTVPPGDGGLSYGQAVVGVLALARRAEPRFTDGVR